MTFPLIFRYNDAAISFKTLGSPMQKHLESCTRKVPMTTDTPSASPVRASGNNVDAPTSVAAPREHFASRLGFILISAGCAIGLGNVWRFPTSPANTAARPSS